MMRVLFVAIQLVLLYAEDQVCEDGTCRADMPMIGRLRPSELAPPSVYTGFYKNASVRLTNDYDKETIIPFAMGNVTQINHLASGTKINTHITVLEKVLSAFDVASLLDLLEDYSTYDMDPDTVDGMPTYEIFVDSPTLGEPSVKLLDSDPNAIEHRRILRSKLLAILQPALEEKITPFVRDAFPKECQRGPDRACTPCYSLIRRYRDDQRQSHAPHHDGHALVTVVVSLSDYHRDYTGGLYVSTGFGQSEYLALNRGDAVVHMSTLLHGVKVYPAVNSTQARRWSWILWYRDSTDCNDYSYQWFAECAAAGDPLCQQLHATKLPDMSHEDAQQEIVRLYREAAEAGASTAAVKMARAHLKQLPGQVEYSVEEAKRYFQIAIDSHSSEGHFGMAQLVIAEVADRESKDQPMEVYWRESKLAEAVKHLEQAAQMGHSYAMFNLGIAHTYGFGLPGNKIDIPLATEWYAESGLPEGFYLAAAASSSLGDTNAQDDYMQRARSLGYFTGWRKEARMRTGTGGAGGVDLNCKWPKAHDGRSVPEF